MTERLRLFLIVALGEVVLTTTGSAIAEHPSRPGTLIAGASAFAITASLWALYFGGTDQLIEEHMAHNSDPVHAARFGANGQYVVLAGLVGHKPLIGPGGPAPAVQPHRVVVSPESRWR